jgi:hypothetical protein
MFLFPHSCYMSSLCHPFVYKVTSNNPPCSVIFHENLKHFYGVLFCFVWVWNSVRNIKARTQTEGFWEQELRRIFGPKQGRSDRSIGKFHNEELHYLFSSTDIIRVTKLRRVRWMVHVAQMGKWEMRIKVWLERLKGWHHSKDIGVDGRYRDAC